MSPKERIQAKRTKARLQSFDRQLENAKWYQSRLSEIDSIRNSESFKKSFKKSVNV